MHNNPKGVTKQGPWKIDKWAVGTNIQIFMFTDLQNNGFQKKLIRQNMYMGAEQGGGH